MHHAFATTALTTALLLSAATAAQAQLTGTLQKIKESLEDTQPIGSLVKLARTTDQAKSLLTFVEAIAEKTLRNTVTLTAARGRGKSAARTSPF